MHDIVLNALQQYATTYIDAAKVSIKKYSGMCRAHSPQSLYTNLMYSMVMLKLSNKYMNNHISR